MNAFRVRKTNSVDDIVSAVSDAILNVRSVPGRGEFEASSVTIEREGELWDVSVEYVRVSSASAVICRGEGFVVVG